MSHRGRPPAWTAEQRERVLELADEGASQRQIAEAVFADARYRGRVERILSAEQTPRNAGALPRISEPLEVEEQLSFSSDLLTLKQLLARCERSLLADGAAPSLADIERLLRIKRQLNAWEQVERSNELSREW